MLRIFLLTIGIYLLYRFIFDFFIPVYRASRRIHRQFKDMQQNGYGNSNGQAGTGPTYTDQKPGSSFSSAPPRDKDYIDFEEIKD